MRRSGPLILGAGPAGAAAAIRLAQAGIIATVVERQAEIGDAICGGFLSWRSVARLEGIGINRAQLGGAPVTELRLFAGDRAMAAPLPSGSMGISRRALDTALVSHALNQGADMRMGQRAVSAEAGTVTLVGGEVLRADSLFLATGKHDLRGYSRPRTTAPQNAEAGLRFRLPHSTARDALIGGAIELHLFPGGYLGLVRQEDGSINACMAVRKSALAAGGGDPRALLARLAQSSPALSDRLDAGELPDGFDAIGAVPYGWRTATTTRGLYRLGDQAAVIPSLAGEGMGIAIGSGVRAAEAWLADGAAGAIPFQRALARSVALPMGIAGLAKTIVTTGFAPSLLRAPGLSAMLPTLARAMRFAS